MSRQRLVSVIVSALALCAGCSGEQDATEIEPASKPGPSGAVCPSQSELTYETFAADFFDSYCVRCHQTALDAGSRHGAPRSINYDSLEAVMAVPAENIDVMAAAGPAQWNTFMPPSAPSPSHSEREKLGEWLACDRR